MLLAVASLAFDIWFFSLRCNSSPDVDWSRFLFSVSLQLAAAALPLIVATIFSEAESEKSTPKSKYSAVSLASFLVLATVPLVRQSVLLSDTTTNKFYESRGYECPGVR